MKIRSLYTIFLLLLATISLGQQNDILTNNPPFQVSANLLQNGKIIVNDTQDEQIINGVSFALERWSDKVDLPITAEVLFVLDQSGNETVLSQTYTITNSDFVPSWALVSSFKYASLKFPANTGFNKLGVVKLKFREKNNGVWSSYRYGNKTYSTAYYIPPTPTPVIIGAFTICSEETYTITNATTVTLEGANNIATITSLGGGQYKVSKIGNGSGKIVLVADNGQNNVSQTIYVGNPSSGDIKDSANGITLQPGTIYQFYVDSGFNLNSFNWSVIGGTIISGQNSNVITVRTDQNPHTADNNLSITLNYVGECGSKTINANRWVAPGGGDIPDPGEIL